MSKMKVLYAKYNRSRKPDFQTETVIFEAGQGKFVAKRALTGPAEKHVAGIVEKCEFAKNNFVRDNLMLPEITATDPRSVTFEYIEGESLDSMLFSAVLSRDTTRFFSVLDDYADFFINGIKTLTSFSSGASANSLDHDFETQLYRDVDMEIIGRERLFFNCVLLDAVFDNIIVKDHVRYFIDNEWIFRSCVPVSFVVYRSLVGFYEHKHDARRMRAFISMDDLLDRFGITRELAALYNLMDDNFQEYVIGASREYQIRRHYIKHSETLENVQERLKIYENRACELNNMIVSHEECMRVLGQKSMTLDTILNSRSWVALRKVCDMIDFIAPISSRRRRCLGFVWRAVVCVFRAIAGFVSKTLPKRRLSILFVDDRVPHFDQDAGSQTSFAYVKLLVKKGFKVRFLADTFHGDQPYTAALEKLGVEVMVGPWYRDNWQTWVMENRSSLDYVYLNRPHIAIKYIEFFKNSTSAKIIYYGHDLHWLRYRRLYELNGSGDALEQFHRWREVESKICGMADVIYFPSDVEARLVLKDFPDAKARAIPAYIYENPVAPSPATFKSRRNLLFVGGFSHAPNEDAVIWFAREVLPLINKEMPEIKFVVAGKNPPAAVWALASEQVVIKGLVSSGELSELYKTTRVVVIPLRYGAGVKGKTVEAMALGAPAVSTSAGIEGMPGVEQFLPVADTPGEFAAETLSLYNDHDKWMATARASVEYVKRSFSEKSAGQALADDLAFK